MSKLMLMCSEMLSCTDVHLKLEAVDQGLLIDVVKDVDRELEDDHDVLCCFPPLSFKVMR